MSSHFSAYTSSAVLTVIGRSKMLSKYLRASKRSYYASGTATATTIRMSSSTSQTRGLVLGVYEPQEKNAPFILTPAAKNFDESTGGRFVSLLEIAGRKLKCGKSRVLFDMDKTYTSIAVCNLGKQDAGFDANEGFDQAREHVRTATAAAVLALRDVGETIVDVDPCNDAEASAEGGTLSLFSYDELKAKEKHKPAVNLICYESGVSDLSGTNKKWARGLIKAEAQNFARRLKETPANKMTPTIFSEEIQSKFTNLKDVQVTLRDQSWAEGMKMGSFLSVAKGSKEPPKFLEIDYMGGQSDDSPVALVGKGVTFDSGGISIKPSADMDKMRADMGGAACVVGTIEAASRLGIPINVKGFIPLCENMPSGTANKPGDVVTAMNGKTIQVDNTDAEGRLILADALCYAETFNPKLIVDLATLTGAIAVALGAGAAGAYTNSQILWDALSKAGGISGDRVWRMPLFKYYSSQVTDSALSDINNVGKKAREAGSCTAAAFLKEFVTTDKWIHLDIAGVMMNKGDIAYLPSGMSGRPTRTLIQFLEIISEMSL